MRKDLVQVDVGHFTSLSKHTFVVNPVLTSKLALQRMGDLLLEVFWRERYCDRETTVIAVTSRGRYKSCVLLIILKEANLMNDQRGIQLEKTLRPRQEVPGLVRDNTFLSRSIP